MIRIDKKGRRIVIDADEPLPGLRTAIPGAYQTVSGLWTVPLSVESGRLLQEKYPGRLIIGQELKRWATGVKQSRQSMAELANSEDADLEVLPRVAPKLYEAMNARTYQRVGVRFIADNPATLVADDPGLGKTLEAIGGILEAEIPGPYLIVAPKTSADTVWRREIVRWLPADHRAIILPELRYQRDYLIRTTRYKATTWLIVHPEIVMVAAWWECVEEVKKTKTNKDGICKKRTVMGSKQDTDLSCGHKRTKKTKAIIDPNYPRLFEIKWGAIINDESHESLIRRNGAPTQRRRGLDMLKLRADGIKLAMSGTPFDSKPHQLWGTLNWLDPKQYSAFHRWAELYWQKGGYTGFEIGEFRHDREKMLWDSLSSIALRRTKGEVAKDLPPKIYVGTPLTLADQESPLGIWLEMEGKQKTAYEQMEEQSVAELESGRLEAITALAELTRLKQLACCYGDIEQKLVRGSCYKKLHGRKISKKYDRMCSDCRRDGFHMELQHFYTPTLPSNKFNWTVEALEEWGYPKNPSSKVVIVSFYSGILRAFARGIHQHFKVKPGRPLVTGITGRTPANRRKAIIDEFNRMDRDTPQVMMLNVKAGGVAITIDSADRMIFISETRSPDQQKQAEDRNHRVSNPRQCWYYYLRSLGTVDIGTAVTNQDLARQTHRLLDQRRGVDYMRQILDLSHQRPTP